MIVDREVALADPVALELLLDELTDGIDPDLVDEDLDPRPRTVDAQEVLAIEDPEDRLAHLQIVAVVELDELIQRRREPGHDRGPAADPDLDAADSVTQPWHERDVVDSRDHVVGVGGGEGGLDLARHRLGRRMADEVADVGARIRGDVEQFVLQQAGPRVAGHVADGVAAALAGGQPDLAEFAHQLRHIAQPDVMHLDVLTRRDVALAQRDVALDDRRERVELIWRDTAERELDPHHLHVGLALPIDALPQPEADEFVLRDLAR